MALTPISDPEAAELGLLVQYAMDMGQIPVTPPLDPRAVGWALRAHILGRDQVLSEEEDVCFGFVAERTTNPGQFVAVLRGTANTLEWIEDAEFLLMACPWGGQVESGFWGLYQRMSLVLPTGPERLPLAKGIAALVGSGSVTVVGHSLAGALGTYLALELALDHVDTGACLFASPQPGDLAFARLFEATVRTYKLFNFELDIVPRVPSGFGYTSLLRATWIKGGEAQARIRFSVDCHHHILCYCAMLHYALAAWTGWPGQDQKLANCVAGPNR
jgi:triacylglycerol lipase